MLTCFGTDLLAQPEAADSRLQDFCEAACHDQHTLALAQAVLTAVRQQRPEQSAPLRYVMQVCPIYAHTLLARLLGDLSWRKRHDSATLLRSLAAACQSLRIAASICSCAPTCTSLAHEQGCDIEAEAGIARRTQPMQPQGNAHRTALDLRYYLCRRCCGMHAVCEAHVRT